MGFQMTINNLNTNSNSDLTTFAVPKLCDNRSNWDDYQPQIQYAMGVKDLWRHIEGTASALVPFPITNGVAMLADGKTVATEEQLEQKK
jgi:hypothetical protein